MAAARLAGGHEVFVLPLERVGVFSFEQVRGTMIGTHLFVDSTTAVRVVKRLRKIEARELSGQGTAAS